MKLSQYHNNIDDIFVPNLQTVYRLDTISYANILQKSWKHLCLLKNYNEHKYERIFLVYIPLKRKKGRMKYSKSGIIVCLRCFYHLLFINPMEYFNTSQPSQCRSPRVPHCIWNLRWMIVDTNQIEIILIFVNAFLVVSYVSSCIIFRT